MSESEFELKDMIQLINESIKNDNVEFLAHIIINLQKEYQEIALLCTDGEFQPSWTHKMVLDHLTYQPKR
jgi:hypothetical protein